MFKEYRISELGNVVGGGTPSTVADDYWNGDIPWITPKDLTGYTSVYISYGKTFITKQGLNKSAAKLLPKNTVLFSSRAPIGYVALAKNPICTNQGFKSIICDETKVSPLYFYYYIKTNLDYIKLFGSGATFPEISGNTMKNIKVNIIENIEQQQKIASILTVYDNLIENNNKRIKILEQMAENLYKEWFVRFRFPCRSKIILQKRSPNGWVISSKATDMVCPGNWEYGSFSRLGKFVRGKNITADKMIEGNIPVVSAGLEPSGYHNVHNVTGKSLTISASGANAGYLKYHLSDIWAADCSYFQDDSKLWFVYNALKFLQPVISNLQIGAAQPHVYPKNINKLCTVIPDDDTMHMYCEKVEPIYEQIQRLKEENQNQIKQRDMLLPRLMSGKLEVK